MEILDSRGRPTVGAWCEFASGARAWASIPSGASTGRAEAVELRDGDPNRHGGLGCRKAVGHVNREINSALRGKSFADQRQLDETIIALDGTPNKSKLGANALLAVSIAFARANAMEAKKPLFEHFASMVDESSQTLPRLTINLFSGGKHAGGQVPIQDVLIVPLSASSIDQGLADASAVYRAATALCARKYQMRPLVADEGGLAPPFPTIDAMLEDAVESIRSPGFAPGKDIAIAIDVASSHFFSEGRYHLEGRSLLPGQMIDQVAQWVERYPIISVEDALAEEDWSNWPALQRRIGNHALVLGDDLLCTNPQRIAQAIESDAASALLLKVNQIGTLTEAAEAHALAKKAGWSITISARSGETEDDWLADLAVGWSGNQIKVGSITRSERLAKYNRLLMIEAQTRWPVANWPKAKP
jgi:enolase